jgi:cytochrome c553
LIRQLANFSADERDSSAMHRVVAKGPMRDPQAWVDVAAYLNKLPMVRFAQTGSGADVALGRDTFKAQCASCHYGDASGDRDGFVPSLRDQHYAYLAHQLRKLSGSARHNVDADLVRLLRNLDEREIAALADYLSRLHGPGRDLNSMRSDGTVVD